MGAVEAKQTDPSSDVGPSTRLTETAGSGKSSLLSAVDTDKRQPVDIGDLELKIARDGTWFYRGTPITRLPLVKLFASVLRREPDGGYWLVTPAERASIAVEDVPFLAVELTVEGHGRDQRLIFRTNLDEFVTAGSDHPLRVMIAAGGEPAPYILLRDGLEARLARPVFYELVELGGEERVGETIEFGVWSAGMFFRLGEPGPVEE
jgi:uncharacterized protein